MSNSGEERRIKNEISKFKKQNKTRLRVCLGWKRP